VALGFVSGGGTTAVRGSVQGAIKATPTVNRIRNVAKESFDYAVEHPRVEGLSRMRLRTDAEVQATRSLRRWTEANDIKLGPGSLEFQVRAANSKPDVVFHPAKQIFDFKLTPKAVRPTQSQNFKLDFKNFNIEYIFEP